MDGPESIGEETPSRFRSHADGDDERTGNDAIALIEGRGETVSTSDALEIIEDLRGRLAKHGVR